MSPLILETAIEGAVVGMKEALKLGAIWFLLRSYFAANNGHRLMRYFYMGVGLASLVFIISFIIPSGLDSKLFLSRLTGQVFFIFFALSLAALYCYPQANSWMDKKWAGWVVLLLTVVYLPSDILGSSMFLYELSAMRESLLSVYIFSGIGFILPIVLAIILLRQPSIKLGSYFGVGQVLLILALVKFLGGGTHGIAELSLVPAVQSGVMKFVHDLIHQTFVYSLVPDHPLLRTTTWDFIAVFFGSGVSMGAALLLLISFPMAFVYKFLTASFVLDSAVDSKDMTGAQRRKLRAENFAMRKKLVMPVVIFIFVVFASWYTGTVGDISVKLEVPIAKPLVEDNGMVSIALSDPTYDLLDGKLHKFSIQVDGETVKLLIIKKSDGKLAVGLDACEICPPEGYGLSGSDVVCIYCMTPIPIDSLGKSGGCNPIPLNAEIGDTHVRINVKDIADNWDNVTSGKSKEGVKR